MSMISVMILALATYPPSMMACTPTPSLSSLRQNYLASLQHRLTILQLRLRGDIMELEAGDSEPHMVTSPTSKLRPNFELGNFCTFGDDAARVEACTFIWLLSECVAREYDLSGLVVPPSHSNTPTHTSAHTAPPDD